MYVEWVESADGLWEACEALLVADHAWVRTVSARLLGLHFATWQQNEAGLGALSQADAGTQPTYHARHTPYTPHTPHTQCL
jgi:hypothetical protein